MIASMEESEYLVTQLTPYGRVEGLVEFADDRFLGSRDSEL